MKKHPSPTPTHLLRFKPCVAMALLFTALLFQSRANVDVDLTLWHGYTFYYGDVNLTTTNPAPVTYYRVESPNALIWQNSGPNKPAVRTEFLPRNLARIFPDIGTRLPYSPGNYQEPSTRH